MKNIIIVLLLLLTACTGWAWNTPGISSPSNGSSTWTSVTLNWNAVSGSQRYQCQIDTSLDFNSPVLRSVTNTYINTSSNNNDTRYDVSNLIFGQTYYWRVRAWIPGDTSAWSTVRSIETRDFVSPTGPSNGSTTWNEVRLNWAPHNGVARYEWQADTSVAFNSPVLVGGQKNYINSTDGNNDTQHNLTGMLFGTQYYWRVRAINNFPDTSEWSSVNSFTTRDFVTLTSPSDGSSTWTGVRLNWEPHDGVAKYEWQADTSASFSSPVLLGGEKNYINSTDGNNDTQHNLADILFGTQYYWRVRAINNFPDTSGWSTVRTFTTRDFVTLTSPTSGSTTWTGVRLNWEPHDDVDKYEWQADTSSAFTSPMLVGGEKNYINSTDGNNDTQHDLSDILFGAQYYWRVRAINSFPDTSAWSTVRTLNTRDFVTLLSPSNGSVNRSTSGFNLDWDAHDNVDRYQVQLDTNSQFIAPLGNAITSYINTSGSNVDTRYATGALLANTIYFWRVRAWHTTDTSEWTMWAFNTGSAPIVYPAAPNLVAPADASTIAGTSTTLQWNAVPTATSYIYEYADNAGFNNTISGTTSDTSMAISGLLGNTTYYWRVRAFNGNLPSSYSSTWTFITPTGTITTNNPAFGAYCTGNTITVDFTSTSIFASNATFTLQLSDANGDFSNPTDIGTATGATTTSVTGTIPNTAATGSGYKVRIVSTQPSITGSPSTGSFTIANTTVTPVITGTSGAECLGATVSFGVATVPGASYTWLLPDNSNRFTPGLTINNFSTADTGQYTVVIALGSCIFPPAVVDLSLGTGPAMPVVTSNADNICLGDTILLSTQTQTGATYVWSGPNGFNSSLQAPSILMTANAAGTYAVTVTQNGCTASGTKVIGLISPVTSTVSNTICFGESFEGYTASGTYTDTFAAANGCDSVRTLILTVRPQNTTTVNESICFGQSFQGYTVAGTYVDTFTAANGCDSVRTLVLSIDPQITSTINQSICAGQSFEGYSNAGTYVDTFTAANGCDSVRTLILTVASTITTTLNQTICFGDSFEGYNIAGTYSDTTTSSGGCDSIRILNLSIRAENATTITETICFGDSFDGYSTSGTYTDVFADNNGCDSTRTLILTVRPQNLTNTSETICFGQSFQGQSTSGVYTTVYSDALGCDSTVVLDLTVLPENTNTINQTICQGERFEGYTASGTYTDTYTAANGCDSTRILILTVNSNNTQTEFLSICSNDTLIINGNLITATGIYTDTVPSTTGGCDTVFTYDVEVLDAPDAPVIVFNELTGELEVTGFFIDLQWFKDGVPVPDGIFNTLIPSGNGVYTVAAFDGFSNCAAISAPYVLGTGTGISQALMDKPSIYPMPTSGILHLEFTRADASRTVLVRDLTGKTIATIAVPQVTESIDISELAAGIYLLEVSTHQQTGVYRIVKE